MFLALSTQQLLNVSGQIVTNKEFKLKKKILQCPYAYTYAVEWEQGIENVLAYEWQGNRTAEKTT